MKTGRAFKDPKSFSAAAKRYFGNISYTETLQKKNGECLLSDEGNPIEMTVWARPPTVSGLCLALGISEEELFELEKNEKYKSAVKRALLVIENFLETELYDGGQYSGVIAGLKIKFGWSEKKEAAADGMGGGYFGNVSLSERIAAAKTAGGEDTE